MFCNKKNSEIDKNHKDIILKKLFLVCHFTSDH